MSIVFCLTGASSKTLTVNPEVVNQVVAAVLELAGSMSDQTLEPLGCHHSVVLAEWPARFRYFYHDNINQEDDNMRSRSRLRHSSQVST